MIEFNSYNLLFILKILISLLFDNADLSYFIRLTVNSCITCVIQETHIIKKFQIISSAARTLIRADKESYYNLYYLIL